MKGMSELLERRGFNETSTKDYIQKNLLRPPGKIDPVRKIFSDNRLF